MSLKNTKFIFECIIIWKISDCLDENELYNKNTKIVEKDLSDIL